MLSHPALLPAFALVLPFVLWPIELFLPYPHFVEEVAKLLLILPLTAIASLRQRLVLAFLLGLFFTLTESVLYFLHPGLMFRFPLFVSRLAITGLLHATTCVLLAVSLNKSRLYLFSALLLAIFFHWLFNHFVSLG